MSFKVFRRALIVVCAALAGVVAAAVADSPTEPNDNLAQAYGPLANGAEYDGSFDDRGDSNDPEFLKFVPATSTVTISVANRTESCQSDCPIGVRVLDGNYELVASGTDAYRPRIPVGSSDSLTIPGLNVGETYYIEITASSTGSLYRVVATGVTGSPPGTTTGTTTGSGTTTGGTTGTDATQPAELCRAMSQALANLDTERDTLSAEYSKARRRAARSRRAADRAAAAKLRVQLQATLARTSNQMREMRAAGCSCELIARTLTRTRATLAKHRSDRNKIRVRKRTAARRRAIVDLSRKIRGANRAIVVYEAGLRGRSCPQAG